MTSGKFPSFGLGGWPVQHSLALVPLISRCGELLIHREYARSGVRARVYAFYVMAVLSWKIGPTKTPIQEIEIWETIILPLKVLSLSPKLLLNWATSLGFYSKHYEQRDWI